MQYAASVIHHAGTWKLQKVRPSNFLTGRKNVRNDK
jgi:hypothetical protein